MNAISPGRWECCLAGFLLALLAFSGVAVAGNVSAQPTNSTVTILTTAGTTTATLGYQVQVFNNEVVPITGVLVSDPTGAVLVVGDIPAGSQGVSAPSSVTVDISNWPTQSLTVPVTLHYLVNGQQVDLQWGLSFLLAR